MVLAAWIEITHASCAFASALQVLVYGQDMLALPT